MMMKCKEASRLVSEGLDRELKFAERVGLRFHLLMCTMCRHVSNQIRLIQRLSNAIGATPSGTPVTGEDVFDDELSPAAKARMKKMLSAKLS